VSHAAAALAFVALAALVWSDQAAAGQGGGVDPAPAGNPLDGILDFAGTDPAVGHAVPAAGNAAPVDSPSLFDLVLPAVTGTSNLDAFLAMIRKSECGTSGSTAYTMLVGGRQFADLTRHPHVYVKEFNSTAAGAYQINWPTWQEIQAALHLPDFSPASQDEAARWLLQKCGALPLIDAGDFAGAVAKAAPRWASLPGAGYGQHENTLASLQAAYLSAGGALA
jgi:muramidase (phage lysozyme)